MIYDGDCPLCRSYVAHMRLRRSAGSVTLLDARQHPQRVASLESRGYGLDEGMVVQLADRIYHGAAAVHLLALLSSRSGWFNRLNYHLFRSRRLSSILYPWLVAGRRGLLWLLGRKPLTRREASTGVNKPRNYRF